MLDSADPSQSLHTRRHRRRVPGPCAGIYGRQTSARPASLFRCPDHPARPGQRSTFDHGVRQPAGMGECQALIPVTEGFSSEKRGRVWRRPG